MIIYLCGPDSYRRLQKQKEIINEYKNKHSNLTIERFYFDNNNDELEQFQDFINARSLFGGSRLAVASGIGNLKNQKPFVEVLKNVASDKTSFVVLSEDKKLGKDFGFLEKKPVLKQEFDNLSGKQFGDFIIREAKKRGVNLNGELLANLVNVHKGDSWEIISELEKIALAPITKFQVPSSKFQVFNEPIFTLIYKLRSGDLTRRLQILESLLKNEDSAKVFNLVAYSVGDKNKFADYDADIKIGKTDYDMALLDWLLV